MFAERNNIAIIGKNFQKYRKKYYLQNFNKVNIKNNNNSKTISLGKKL